MTRMAITRMSSKSVKAWRMAISNRKAIPARSASKGFFAGAAGWWIKAASIPVGDNLRAVRTHGIDARLVGKLITVARLVHVGPAPRVGQLGLLDDGRLAVGLLQRQHLEVFGVL